MKKYVALAVFSLFALAVSAQQGNQVPLTVGAARLFKNNPSKLTNEEKNWLFAQLGITPAEDIRLFKSGEYDVAAQEYVTDMNKDGIEEVFLVMQSAALFGELGQTFLLYIKNSKGKFEKQEELGYGMVMIITSDKKAGYPDIALGGPGNLYPVCKWDGKKYKPSTRKIKDTELSNKTVTYIDVAESNMQYLETFK